MTPATTHRRRRSWARSAGWADGVRYRVRGYADAVPDQSETITAPFAGTVIAVARTTDEPVGDGETVLVLEAMKMEHEVVANAAGIVRRIDVDVGETVVEGQVLAVIQRDDEILRREPPDAMPAL